MKEWERESKRLKRKLITYWENTTERKFVISGFEFKFECYQRFVVADLCL